MKGINTTDSQRGAVLVTALVFLVILTLLGITSMSTNTLEERMAGNSQDANRAFQAAESGLSAAFNSDEAFAGTTEGYTTKYTEPNFGGYSAEWGYKVDFRGGEDIIGFQEAGEATAAGGGTRFRWYYSDIRGIGRTKTGAITEVVAGAKVLGQ